MKKTIISKYTSTQWMLLLAQRCNTSQNENYSNYIFMEVFATYSWHTESILVSDMPLCYSHAIVLKYTNINI
jgi:hypothetical protein